MKKKFKMKRRGKLQKYFYSVTGFTTDGYAFNGDGFVVSRANLERVLEEVKEHTEKAAKDNGSLIKYVNVVGFSKM